VSSLACAFRGELRRSGVTQVPAQKAAVEAVKLLLARNVDVNETDEVRERV
jgi:hypothetical protein